MILSISAVEMDVSDDHELPEDIFCCPKNVKSEPC